MLATEYGYTTVISSGLSILGVLGLVKSSIKLALGLRQCISSGWNPDSLRGIFGYDFDESERSRGKTRDCLRVSVFQEKDQLVIDKERQRFDDDKVPILAGGIREITENAEMPAHTIINIGNMIRESEFTQSPWIIGLLLFLCSALTSWVLLIASFSQDSHWHWTVVFGIVGLHLSLIIMLAAPLWHAYRTCRPSNYASGEVWAFLTCTQDDSTHVPTKFTFMRTCSPAKDGVHQVLHFCGDVSYLSTLRFKILMVTVSGMCTVSYICQYAVLKGAEDTAAAVWIGIQAGFALLRVLIWILDPPFDDPRSSHAEYIAFDNGLFSEFSLMRILTDFMGDGVEDFEDTPTLNPVRRRLLVPQWALHYLQGTDFGQALQNSKPQHPQDVPQVTEPDQTTMMGPTPGSSGNSRSDVQRYPSSISSGPITPKVDDENVAGYYVLETSLSVLYDRRIASVSTIAGDTESTGSTKSSHENEKAAVDDKKKPDRDKEETMNNQEEQFTDLTKALELDSRLILLRFENPDAPKSPLVRPCVVVNMEKPFREDRTDLTDVVKYWRYGRRIYQNWLPTPTLADIKSWQAQPEGSTSDDTKWKYIVVGLDEFMGDYKTGYSELRVVWQNSYSLTLAPKVLAAFEAFHDYDFNTLKSAPHVDEPSLILDTRQVPLSRSWTILGAAQRGYEIEPRDWLDLSLEEFSKPMFRKQKDPMFRLKFGTAEQAMKFAACYLDYTEELSMIKLLKRVNKFAALMDGLESFLEWITHIPILGIDKLFEKVIYTFLHPVDFFIRSTRMRAARSLKCSRLVEKFGLQQSVEMWSP